MGHQLHFVVIFVYFFCQAETLFKNNFTCGHLTQYKLEGTTLKVPGKHFLTSTFLFHLN